MVVFYLLAQSPCISGLASFDRSFVHVRLLLLDANNSLFYKSIWLTRKKPNHLAEDITTLDILSYPPFKFYTAALIIFQGGLHLSSVLCY